MSASASTGASAGAASPGAADDAAGGARAWARFTGARSAQEFCAAWLELQCAAIPGAAAGLLALEAGNGRFGPSAVWPEEAHDLSALAPVAERALATRRPVAERLGSGAVLIAHPIDIRGALYGAAAIALSPRGESAAARDLQALQWGAGWLEVLFRRRQADADSAALRRAETALELCVGALESPDPRGAAMALANALCARLGARSAAVGLRRGRRMELMAISGGAWFRRRSELALALASAMEESLEQLAPTAWPELPRTAGRISVAQKALADRGGGGAAISAPLLAAGRPVGAVVVEFDPMTGGAGQAAGSAAGDEAALLLEAAAALAGAALEDKARAHRLIAGRGPAALGRFWRDLRDPRRVTGKLALLALAGLVGWLCLSPAELRVTARAAVEGEVQRAVTAPVDGFVDAAPLRAGDVVEEGALLVRLDDRDLALEALRLRSELAQAMKEYRDALARKDRQEAALLQSRIDETEAQIALADAQRARLEIRSPIGGVVVSGDLTQSLGSPVGKGEELFVVAPLSGYRVVLEVDERDVLLVRPGQEGVLTLSALTDARLAFDLVHVTPVSTPRDGRNFFRAEARLRDAGAPLRPGMEGVGKIGIRRSVPAWVWLRPVVEWARLTLWRWTP